MTNGRRFDIVVYGATGFTGGLVVEYLAQHGPTDLKWAIAGRSQGKLLAVRDRAARKNPACRELPILSASAEDRKSLDAMASATRVVLTTVGPYVKYGLPLVLASGPGAEARIALGWPIVGGWGLATVSTLFLTPVA